MVCRPPHLLTGKFCLFRKERYVMQKAMKRYAPLFIMPTFAAFLIGFIIPFFQGIYLSFCQFTTVGNAKFNGITNYVKAFSDSFFFTRFCVYSCICFSFNYFHQCSGIFTGIIADKRAERNQYISYCFFYAEFDWRNCFRIYLADFDQLCAFYYGKTTFSAEYQCGLLGAYCSDVLAADWVYDDYLYCRTSECV